MKLGRRHPKRTPAGLRLLGVLLIVGAVLGFGVHKAITPPPLAPAAEALAGPAPLHRFAGRPGQPGPGGDPHRDTLVLYDTAGPSWQAGQSYAIQAANLLSRAGHVTLQPVSGYHKGEDHRFTAMVYIGSSGAQHLSFALLTDMLSGTVPTMWIDGNISQMFARAPARAAGLGWRIAGRPLNPVAVVYKGARLRREPRPDNPVHHVVLDPRSSTQVEAWAVTAGGTRIPWAVKTGTFTYLAENPFNYVDYGGRYLAAADLLRALALPTVPDQHRALVRLEDVGAKADPQQLRAIATYLHRAHVPFTVAVYPVYVDVTGAYDHGHPTTLRLADRPKIVAALKYMVRMGGTIEEHGYTHQYDHTRNPLGVSGADYEFYRVRSNGKGYEKLAGPVPKDSPTWAVSRIERSRAEITRVGLPDPGIFEVPHYTASAVDYRAINNVFGVRDGEGTYFSARCRPGHGPCSHLADPKTLFQQYFPYPVRDDYGSVVIPENLGYLSPQSTPGDPRRTAADLIGNARKMLVVRDSVASFFYHPYLGIPRLRKVVTGIQKLGYHFVSPTSLLHNG